MTFLSAALKCGRPDTLAVVFNSDRHHAGRAPDLPFRTHFEGYGAFSTLRATVVWFAESDPFWYLEHEAAIHAFLCHYMARNGVERVALMGLSAGAYAATRQGILLSAARFPGRRPDITCFAINPQTGFRFSLLHRILGDVEREKWDKGALGRDPIILNQYSPDLCRLPLCDISAFAREMPYRDNDRFHVLYDQGNPIVRGFAEDLLGLPGFQHHPEALGVSHGASGQWLWRALRRSGRIAEALADTADALPSQARVRDLPVEQALAPC